MVSALGGRWPDGGTPRNTRTSSRVGTQAPLDEAAWAWSPASRVEVSFDELSSNELSTVEAGTDGRVDVPVDLSADTALDKSLDRSLGEEEKGWVAGCTHCSDKTLETRQRTLPKTLNYRAFSVGPNRGGDTIATCKHPKFLPSRPCRLRVVSSFSCLAVAVTCAPSCRPRSRAPALRTLSP